MRRMIDVRCDGCGEERVDQYADAEKLGGHECGGTWQKVTLSMPIAGRAAPVHGDDIPGGILMHHGVCNADGTPRRYYSKSEIVREAKRRGLHNHVEHIPDRGSDKSKNTTRWV